MSPPLPTQIQFASDLHLEIPFSSPQYSTASLSLSASHLLLAGDIGRTTDTGLFTFLRRLLTENRGCKVLFLIGNHEAYGSTLEECVSALRNFEDECKAEYGGRFKLLNRDRYDLNDEVSVLGCTLWSRVRDEQALGISTRLTDLDPSRGIRKWNLETMRREHERDLEWLNEQVTKMEKEEPKRRILVATHYCPTTDERATAPQHVGSPVSSAFVTDLSGEMCWRSAKVKAWVFGHTHYSCGFRDEEGGKLVLANQRGYAFRPGVRPRVKLRMIEMRGQEWEVDEDEEREQKGEVSVEETGQAEAKREMIHFGQEKTKKASFIKRASQKVRGLIRM